MKLLSDLGYIKKNEKLHKRKKLRLNLNKKIILNSLLSDALLPSAYGVFIGEMGRESALEDETISLAQQKRYSDKVGEWIKSLTQ